MLKSIPAVLVMLLFGFARVALSAVPTIGEFEPIEIPIPHSQQGVQNVWDDVTVSAILTAPDQTTRTIGGFYHSSNLWMVRFAPDEIGTWNYTITLLDRGNRTVIQDSFKCIASNEQGFLRLDSADGNHRWYYSGSGKLFSGVGFGDCMPATRDSILEDGFFDGGYRPAGVNNAPGFILPYAQYLISYGDVAGFNLYRYSDGNCAYSIIRSITGSGNGYDTLHSLWTDTLFRALRAHGFRIYMTILGSPIGNSSNANDMAAVDRYAEYCIDRYGAFVDFWELTNESTPDSLWISNVAGYIHSRDPYHHMVSMSWQQPNHPAIDIISPHWYGRENVLNSDQATASEIDQYSSANKPVIFGEQGEGEKWDSLSPARLRGRIWSAFFNAGTIIFWNTSFAKDCPCNQYLGWPERREVRILQNFTKCLKPDIVSSPVKKEGACNIWEVYSQGYDQMAAYIRNDQNISAINNNVTIQLGEVARGGEAIWYDVHTGDILQRVQIPQPPLPTLTAPPFQGDIALIAGVFADSLVSDSLFRVDVNPRTISFLSVPKNSTVTAPIGIRNNGSETVTIPAAQWTNNPSGYFDIDQFKKPLTLAPGDTATLTLSFSPKDTGIFLNTLSLARTGSPSWENVAIDATVVPASSVATTDATVRELSVEPNPAGRFVTVQNLEVGTSYRYEVTSVLGVLMAQGEVNSDRIIDLESIPNGVYRLTILDKTKNVGSTMFAFIQ